MILYATPEELAAYIDPDSQTPPEVENATVLLRAATKLVQDATAGAVYRTDADGIAIDAKTREALAEATMEHASALSLNGIDPRKGAAQIQRRVASKSVTGVSVSYVKDDAADLSLSALATGDHLTDAAYRILLVAGLISNRVNSRGGAGVERFNISQRYYDPTTGVLDAPL